MGQPKRPRKRTKPQRQKPPGEKKGYPIVLVIALVIAGSIGGLFAFMYVERSHEERTLNKAKRGSIDAATVPFGSIFQSGSRKPAAADAFTPVV